MSYKGEKNQAGFRLSISTLSAQASESGERPGMLHPAKMLLSINNRDLLNPEELKQP